MGIGRVAVLFCIAGGSIGVPVAAGAESKASVMAGPPELCTAVAVNGHTIEVRRFVERAVTRTTIPNLPQDVRIEIKGGTIDRASSPEVVHVVEVRTTQMEAVRVMAWRVDGRAVSHEVLMKELARPTPVVLAKHGQQVDPIFLRMFQPESLILLFPSATAPPTTVAPD